MGKLGVLIVDDYAVVRTGLRAILNNDPRLEVVGEAADGMDACTQAATLHPPVVIMDVSMPTLNGADATRKLLKVSPASSIIALTAYDEPAYVRELLDAGARGYVLKRSVIEQLVRAIEVVTEAACSSIPPSPNGRPHMLGPTRPCPRRIDVPRDRGRVDDGIKPFKRRDRRDLEDRGKDRRNSQDDLMAKLGLHTRAQLVRFAIYRGWLVSR